jgi:acetyl-CoA C-acetyltransferase
MKGIANGNRAEPMRDALIVSVARTPIGRAVRGAFNATPSPTLAAHALRAAVARAGVEPHEIDDFLLGCSLPQGVQQTIGRMAALRAGFPVSVPGMTLDRQCSSGLMTIATAAKQIIVDRMDICVAGGVESISLVQTEALRIERDPELVAMHDDAYMPMIDTAEVVAERYGISRDLQDAYAFQSQRRTAAAQAAGRFDAEIVPVTARMTVVNKETGAASTREVTIAKDEGNRPETTRQGLASLKSVRAGGTITAGNASQLSDGAAAVVLMEPISPSGAGSCRLDAMSGWPLPVRGRMKWESAPCLPCRNFSSASASRRRT